MWLGNNEVYKDIVTLTQQLLTHQRDFDYINDDAFTAALTLGPGYLENKSSQRYETLIIPSSDVISVSAWKVIETFSSRGGKVLFWGKKPASFIDKNFTAPGSLSDLTNSRIEPSTRWTAHVSSSLPEPEMKIISPDNDSIRYTRRVMPDGDLYFIFNEGNKATEFTADFDKEGVVKEWNATDGTLQPINATIVNNRTRLTIQLEAWESKLISIGKNNREYNIKEYGVKGNGYSETATLQRIINEAAHNGGGTIVIPAGEYLSGALFFPRGVDLRIEKNAKLISTFDPNEFPVIPTRFEGIEKRWRCAFLNFDHSDGVKVYGEGVIDGKGVEWKKIPFGNSGRPRLVCFTDCPGGKISGLKMINQASWCLHVLYTNGFTIDGIDIRALEYIPSSDGIDIDSSNDILITSTRIEAHDDCISIKSGRDEDGRRVGRPSENILIENCHFAYGHGGVAMGSEISGDIRNVTIRSCLMDNENWSPLRFKSQPSRGGTVENITFEDIIIKGARSIFDINMEWRMVPPLLPAHYPLTCLRNIHFKNINGEAQSAGTMYGFKEAPFGNDTFFFENCHIKAQKGLSISNVANVNFKGLELEIKEGEKIYERSANKDK